VKCRKICFLYVRELLLKIILIEHLLKEIKKYLNEKRLEGNAEKQQSGASLISKVGSSQICSSNYS